MSLSLASLGEWDNTVDFNAHRFKGRRDEGCDVLPHGE
jgi:hypothetical protein